MNEVTPAGSRELALPERNSMINTLRNSLYPGAQIESVALVLDYCQAAKLDPLQKPVHIVPMYVVDKQTGKKETRDVIMPGIGLYRTQAARTGRLAGIDEPVFGEDVEYLLEGVKYTVPISCTVTVYRIVEGQRCAFSAKELWLENYATANRETQKPNAMWTRRSYGQLAKCAEAQALRKAFPEVGSMPTAEEFDGRQEWDDTPADAGANKIKEPKVKKEPPAAPPADAPAPPPADPNVIDVHAKTVNEASAPAAAPAAAPATQSTGETISAGKVKFLEQSMKAVGLDQAGIDAMFGRFNIPAGTKFEALTPAQYEPIKVEIMGMM